MNYNFDKIISREATDCEKFDARDEVFGRADVIPMWVADMDFAVPEAVTEAIVRRAGHPIYGYTFRSDGYFRSVIDWVGRHSGWKVEKEWIDFAPGVVAGIVFALRAFTQEGDRVVIQPPVYHPFARQTRFNNRVVVNNPLLQRADGSFGIDFDDLDRKLAGAKVFLMSNPHNPSGRVYTAEELTRIGELCVKHDVVILSDEIHGDLVYKPHKHIHIAALDEAFARRTVTFTAPSKTFNLATLQTSNIVIPDEELRTKFQSILQQHFTPSAGALGLEACRLGYTECEGWLAEVINLIYKNYKNFCKFIDVNCPGVTYSDLQGTYLMWIDCTTFGLDDEALDKLLRKHDLFCDAGTLFSQGGTMHTRVNLAGPEKMLNAAMQRFKDAYDEAKNA